MALLAELVSDASIPGRFQLMSLTASEGLSRPFEYQVELLSDKPGLTLPDYLGKGMTVSLKLIDGKRYFHGLVARFAHTGRRTRQFYHYTATLRPWFWFLSRTQDCRIFQDMTVVEIVEKVFADHSAIAKVKKKLTGTYTKWTYCVQYRESDMNFVARMLEQEGIYYYFTHTQAGHELVLCDNMSAHTAVGGYETIPFSANWADDEEISEHVSSWGVGVQVLPTKAVLGDFDFEKPATVLRKEHSVSRTHDLASYEVFDYPGEYTEPGDGVAYAKVRAEEQQAGYKLVNGDSDARGMTCGSTFTVSGLPDEAQNGEYLLTSTNIYVEEGVQVGAQERGDGHYSCHFQAMPTAEIFRPSRTTPKPMVYGPQTAMVVGTEGEGKIHTDKYGRIRVQFHWDREGKKDEGKSTCWMRVSQPWAGKNFGAISIPRIGDEVVVSFMEGDPDQPLVTGRVYNADYMPPYELPAKAFLTGILSRSVGSTAAAEANELRFSDDPGSEYIWLQAQKDFHREVENDDHDTVKNNQYIDVTGDREEKVGKDVQFTVGGSVKTAIAVDNHLDVGGDHIQAAGGVLNIKAGRDFALEAGSNGGMKIGSALDIKAGTDMKAEGGMNVDIKGGMNVTIQAGMTLTLKAGACTVVLGPSGVSIDGPMVNINCGGGGGSAQSASPAAPAAPQAAKAPDADVDPNK
jgi:type VI secretion system secreted protein VgrG